MNRRKSELSGSIDRKTGSVLVIYENRSARARAVSFCEDLIQRSGNNTNVESHLSSFDALKAPERFNRTIQQGCTVDLIVFAVDPEGDFPPEIKRWTERWIVERGEREGTLIGLVDKGPYDIACLKEIYLRHVAHRAGLDYLSQVPSKLPEEIDLMASLNQREGQVTSVLAGILHVKLAPPELR